MKIVLVITKIISIINFRFKYKQGDCAFSNDIFQRGIMKIQTSLRLYDIMLIKAHREDLKKPNNSNLSWLQEINRRAKTLINELGREMRERCTGVDYFFNGYPLSNFSCRKLKNCSKDLINEENALASGVFGKFDLVMIPKIPHAYWTSAFRVKALEIFHDLMNIPAHRVRLEIIRGESDIRLVSKKCLMLLSFIKLETFRDEKDPSNALKNIINKVSNCNFSQKYRTELLLTFSTSYPFVIKAEFDNFDQFTNYLHEINKVNYVTETNSMVLYQNNYNDLKNPNPLSVAVLMKIKKNTENIIVKQVTDSINRLNFVEDQKIEPLHRAFYWDLNFHFDTRDIASLIEFTTNGVAQNNNIINSVTLPFWKCDYQIPKFKRANQDIVRGKNQFKNYNKRKRELSAFIKRFRKTMPRPDLTAPLILGDDIVARRIYEIKFESEWIITQSEHLFTAWERIFDEYPYSFYSIRTEYLMYLRNVKKALDYLNSANLTDKIIRTIKSSSNKRIYENIQNILENK
ncbi:hypothetical protein JXA40_11890, partial [bacterium]|nr:hypothetical protein [candidate division CSSED10-310 bacterium]